MVFLGDPDQLLAALDAALAEPYSLFSFERGPAEPIGTTQSQRLDIKVAFNGRSWATVRLEISPPEGRSGDESQVLDAISIEDFGLTGPEKVRCLYSRHVNNGRLRGPHLTHYVRRVHIAHHDGR